MPLVGARRNDPLVDSHAQAFSSFITEDDRGLLSVNVFEGICDILSIAAPLFPSADLNFDASVEGSHSYLQSPFLICRQSYWHFKC